MTTAARATRPPLPALPALPALPVRAPSTAPTVALAAALACVSLLVPTRAHADPKDWSLGVLTGARSAGNGDPNGFDSMRGAKIVLVTPGGWDYGVHFLGLTIGRRFRWKSGAYASFGGTVFSLTDYGVGAGVTTAVGYEVACLGLCFVTELQQEALANLRITKTTPVFATTWAVRLGLSLNL